MSSNKPGPNATLIGHAAVGVVGAALLHAVVKPATDGAKLLVWLLAAAAMICLHAYFDAPVSRRIAETFPALG